MSDKPHDPRFRKLLERYDEQGQPGFPWLTLQDVLEELALLIGDATEPVPEGLRRQTSAYRLALAEDQEQWGGRGDSEHEGEAMVDRLREFVELGYQDDHARWLVEQQRNAESLREYQGSEDAQRRRLQAAQTFGIAPEQIVLVEPPTRFGTNA